MVRSIITPSITHVIFSIPKDYIGKQVEITCLALEEIEKDEPILKTMKGFWNTISEETATEMHKEVEQNRNGWDKNI